MVRVWGIVGRTEGAKKKQINEMISKQKDLGFVSVLPHACCPCAIMSVRIWGRGGTDALPSAPNSDRAAAGSPLPKG